MVSELGRVTPVTSGVELHIGAVPLKAVGRNQRCVSSDVFHGTLLLIFSTGSGAPMPLILQPGGKHLSRHIILVAGLGAAITASSIYFAGKWVMSPRDAPKQDEAKK